MDFREFGIDKLNTKRLKLYEIITFVSKMFIFQNSQLQSILITFCSLWNHKTALNYQNHSNIIKNAYFYAKYLSI